MTIICGTLKSRSGDSRHPWTGTINTRRINTAFAMVPNARARNEKDAPKFLIYEVKDGALGPHIGSAWEKHSETASDFFQLTFDQPEWDVPLYVAAFAPDDKAGDWVIQWKRPRKIEVQQQAAA